MDIQGSHGNRPKRGEVKTKLTSSTTTRNYRFEFLYSESAGIVVATCDGTEDGEEDVDRKNGKQARPSKSSRTESRRARKTSASPAVKSRARYRESSQSTNSSNTGRSANVQGRNNVSDEPPFFMLETAQDRDEYD